MTTEDDKKAGDQQTFTEEQVRELINESIKDLKGTVEDQKAHISKLNEENKNKRLSEKEIKDSVVKALGLTEEEKTDNDILTEKLTGMSNSITELQKKLADAETAKTKLEQQTKLKEVAQELGFQDPSDALKFIGLDCEDPKAELTKVLETKPYLKGTAKKVGGDGNPAGGGNKTEDEQREFDTLLKKKDKTGADRRRFAELGQLLTNKRKDK